MCIFANSFCLRGPRHGRSLHNAVTCWVSPARAIPPQRVVEGFPIASIAPRSRQLACGTSAQAIPPQRGDVLGEPENFSK